MFTPYLDQLRSQRNTERAAGMASYHKGKREYLGLTNPQVNDMTKEWRQDMSIEQRVEVAAGLWQSDIFEARLAATKLLTQARIRPDEEVWQLLLTWVPDFDSWALADHACSAIQKRLVADPSRLDVVETWTKTEHLWTRRAALVATLPWTKQNHPKPDELACRDRILGWAAAYVPDRRQFIQKTIAEWLRELSKHDAPKVRDFLAEHGDQMKNFARKEAGKYLPD